jgi:hypothetical protein
MQIKTWIAAAILSLGAGASLAADKMPQNWDGLVEVKSKKFDAAYLAPGTDFRTYSKIMVDPTQVAFHKNWLKNVNDQRDLSRKVSEEDAQEIMAAARSNFDDIFAEAFSKAGYTVVSTPGPDVLRVATAVINLYVNAPDTMTAGRSVTYSASAGEATLVIELHDSITGALLGRVLDRRETLDSVSMQQANKVTNLSDFRNLFKSWAKITVNGIAKLKEISPIPDPLTPGQNLAK